MKGDHSPSILRGRWLGNLRRTITTLKPEGMLRLPQPDTAIYARYSTDLQDETSIEDQFYGAGRYAEQQQLTLSPDLHFADYAVSGASIHDRQGLEAMLKAAHEKRFKTLVIESLSRLSRRLADSQNLYDTMQFLGIEIREYQSGDKLNSTTAAIKGMVAQIQREDTAKLVRRGLDGIVRRGNSAGGRAYGYRSLPKYPHDQTRGGLLEIVDDEAVVVVEICERYVAGETPRNIAHDLNRRGIPAPRGRSWRASCISGFSKRGSGILNNELYNGVRIWNKNRMVKNPANGRRVSRPNEDSEKVVVAKEELRIVSPELWAAVADRKAQQSKLRPQQARKANRVFSGLLRCAACGSGMSVKGTDKTGRHRIQCSRHKESGDCPDPRTYYIDEIERRVLAELRSELLQPDAIKVFLNEYELEIRRLRESSSSKRASVERDLAKAAKRAERLNDLIINGLCDPARTMPELNKALDAERHLRDQLVAINAATSAGTVSIHPACRDRYVEAVRNLHEHIGSRGSCDAAKVIRELVESIIVHPTGTAQNRHTRAPNIEIVGKLEAIVGQKLLTTTFVGGLMVAKERFDRDSGLRKIRV